MKKYFILKFLKYNIMLSSLSLFITGSLKIFSIFLISIGFLFTIGLFTIFHKNEFKLMFNLGFSESSIYRISFGISGGISIVTILIQSIFNLL